MANVISTPPKSSNHGLMGFVPKAGTLNPSNNVIIWYQVTTLNFALIFFKMINYLVVKSN